LHREHESASFSDTMSIQPSQAARWIGTALLSCALAFSLTACSSWRTGHAKPTQSDRLVEAYPALRSGRFAVIADFENEAHMQLAHLVSVSPDAKCVLDTKKGRKETGRACLSFHAASPDDAVVFNNDDASEWYLKRDWRQYDLFLMSVHAARPDTKLDLSISAQTEGGLLGVRSLIPLEMGWNLLPIDLAEVGEHVPLDNVTEIRLALADADRPTTVWIDDLLLTGNRIALFGDPENDAGDLYVQQVGRRWRIGAGHRFELTFANGQIVGWYNTTDDPYRQQNLVQGTTLGPSPVVVEPVNQPNHDFSALGEMVIARPQILEMNAVRVVVGSDWRFVDSPDQAVDGRPFQQWIYTIYRTGQVYVTTRCTSTTDSWQVGELGLAVTVASGGDDQLRTQAARRAEPDGTATIPAFGSARITSGNAYLLYASGGNDLSSRMIVQTDQDQKRASFVALTAGPEGGVRQWRSHLLLARRQDVSDDEAVQRAFDYARPVISHLEIGALAGDAALEHQDEDAPLTGESTRIRPDGGRVRFVIDGQVRPRYSPAFEIVGADRREAWVYVNNLVYAKTSYNATGSLLFQLPGIIRDRTTVEVFFRDAAHSEDS